MIHVCRHGYDSARCVRCAEIVETARWEDSQRAHKEAYTDGQSACAAGPWHDASEEPPARGTYLTRRRLSVQTMFWVSEDKSWLSNDDRECDAIFDWAEIREPDHLPDAGKMTEKGEDNG